MRARPEHSGDRDETTPSVPQNRKSTDRRDGNTTIEQGKELEEGSGRSQVGARDKMETLSGRWLIWDILSGLSLRLRIKIIMQFADIFTSEDIPQCTTLCLISLNKWVIIFGLNRYGLYPSCLKSSSRALESYMVDGRDGLVRGLGLLEEEIAMIRNNVVKRRKKVRNRNTGRYINSCVTSDNSTSSKTLTQLLAAAEAEIISTAGTFRLSLSFLGGSSVEEGSATGPFLRFLAVLEA
uniref:Uncharacterized protein n=1 Tax=Oryza meridionalis TaxID=40149 RepID=A0A0E0CDS0_9ORYZ